MNTHVRTPGLNARAFRAMGDGETDDTVAIQTALDQAAVLEQTVFLPEGVYLVGQLKVHAHSGLAGMPSWSYREGGGSVLKLHDPTAECMVDITGARGASLHGLTLDGSLLGEGVHGVFMGECPDKKQEDSPVIDRCHISKFTGDGIRLDPVWCFSVRHCEVIMNRGDGLRVRGWDGFILDNWFSGNHGCGYHAPAANASVTMTGNRIEWNHKGGIRICGGSHYNVTGNYVDRSGGPGIAILGRKDAPSFCLTVTGNVIYRSGKPDRLGDDPLESSHVRLEEAHGLVFTGNSMCTGQDDGGGTMSPQLGIVMRALQNSLVKDNAMHIGAIKELIRDLGEHKEGVIVKDNPGSLFVPREGENLWTSGQI